MENSHEIQTSKDTELFNMSTKMTSSDIKRKNLLHSFRSDSFIENNHSMFKLELNWNKQLSLKKYFIKC